MKSVPQKRLIACKLVLGGEVVELGRVGDVFGGFGGNGWVGRHEIWSGLLASIEVHGVMGGQRLVSSP